jgi:hypothetical protein
MESVRQLLPRIFPLLCVVLANVNHEKWLAGVQTTLLTTELNGLINNSLALGAAFNNLQGQTGDGYTFCDVELVATYGTAPGANRYWGFCLVPWHTGWHQLTRMVIQASLQDACQMWYSVSDP